MPPEQSVTDQDTTGTVAAEEAETASAPETGDRQESKPKPTSKPAGSRETREDRPTGWDDDFDKDRARSTIRGLRDSEKAATKRVKELEAQIKEREDAELSANERLQRELERAKADHDQLQQQLTERDEREKQRNFRDAIAAAGEKAGAKRPSLLHKLVDMADVKLDDDGAPANPDRVVAKLRESVPELFKDNAGHGNADAGAGKDADQPGVSVDSWLRQATGRNISPIARG